MKNKLMAGLCMLQLLQGLAPLTVSAAQTHVCTQINEKAVGSPLWRLYNPNSGEHFYTLEEKERDHLAKVGWSTENYGWFAEQEKGDPVYRLYNPNAGDHHYTTSETEKNHLAKVGWTYEGVAWLTRKEKKGDPVFREYNPNAKTGSHNFTTNKTEHDFLIKNGWKDEGIAFYSQTKNEVINGWSSIQNSAQSEVTYHTAQSNPTKQQTLQSSITSKQQEVAKVQKQIDDLQALTDSSNAQIQTFQSKKATFEQTIKNLQNELAALEANPILQSNYLSGLQSSLNQKNTQITAKQAEMNNLQTQLNQAKSNYSQYEEVINMGSLGFFYWCTGEIRFLRPTVPTDKAAFLYGNSVNEIENTSYNAIGDATSLTNLRQAILMIEEGNSIRKSEGKSVLNISLLHMLYAELSCNEAAVIRTHPYIWSLTENLAWGSVPPYTLWYTKEKALFESGVQDSRVGHYRNLMRDNMTVTGGAINTKMDYATYEQNFSTQGNYQYTTQDLLAKLNEFESSYVAQANAAKSVVTSAENAVTAKQNEILNLQDEKNSIQTKINNYSAEKAAVENSITSTREGINTSASNRDLMDSLISQYQAGNNNRQTEQNKYNRQKTSLNSEISGLQNELNGLKSHDKLVSTNQTIANRAKEKIAFYKK